MNNWTAVLYLFTWLLAILFFFLWRRARDEAEFQEVRGDTWREHAESAEAAANYYEYRLEVDERLLLDPDLRFVGTCDGCEKVEDKNGEPCKVLLSFDNYTKSNYCSQFRRRETNGSDLQTTQKPPISRTAQRYEGTLRRIESKQGQDVGNGNSHNTEADK